jgi:hypothetical protein
MGAGLFLAVRKGAASIKEVDNTRSYQLLGREDLHLDFIVQATTWNLNT